MATKKVTLAPKLTALAATDVSSALCYQIENAFGITADAIISCTRTMVAKKDEKMMYFCIAAGVQIRGNVTFAAPSILDMKANYPQLTIDTNRDTGDNVHFKGCHIIGHVLANITDDLKGSLVLKKAGDCALGGKFPETDAGKINKTIFEEWDDDERKAIASFVKGISTDAKAFVDTIFASISAKAKVASEAVNGKPAAASKVPPKPSTATSLGASSSSTASSAVKAGSSDDSKEETDKSGTGSS